MADNGPESRTELLDVFAYARVSTGKQADTGYGLDAQKATIRKYAELRGWNIVEWSTDEGISGKNIDDRPGLQHALDRIENGGPDVLVAAKLDRIARSALDFLSLVQRAEDNGWSLIVLDTGRGNPLDMTDPYGKFTATVMAGVAELERDLAKRRTKEAMAAAKERGVHLGTPPWGLKANPDYRADRRPSAQKDIPQFVADPAVMDIEVDGDSDDARRAAQQVAKKKLLATVEHIVFMRENGATLQEIADHLNDANVRTSGGRSPDPKHRDAKSSGKWWPSTVSNVLKAADKGAYHEDNIA